MIPIGCQPAQTRPDDFGSQMVDYAKQGRYDDAIQVGIKALENKPTDEVVYQQIAIVYLILELATSAVTDPTDETVFHGHACAPPSTYPFRHTRQ
jgi:tetratricopeptide (TPR) repeat protein